MWGNVKTPPDNACPLYLWERDGVREAYI